MRSPIYSNPLAVAGTVTWGTDKAMILPLDYIQLAYGVFVGGILTEDQSAITWTAYMTADDSSSDSYRNCSLSQTTTVITITDATLPTTGGVTTGDIVHIFNSGITTGSVDGWYTVTTTPSTTTFTVTSGTSQSKTGSPFTQYQMFRLFAAPAAITAATTRVSASLSHSTTGPVRGLAMKVSARTAGALIGVVVQGAGP